MMIAPWVGRKPRGRASNLPGTHLAQTMPAPWTRACQGTRHAGSNTAQSRPPGANEHSQDSVASRATLRKSSAWTDLFSPFFGVCFPFGNRGFVSPWFFVFFFSLFYSARLNALKDSSPVALLAKLNVA